MCPTALLPVPVACFFAVLISPQIAAVIVRSNTWSVCLEKKSKKDESKVSNVKEKNSDEEKKKGKPKAHAPSHAKIRSIGRFSLGR